MIIRKGEIFGCSKGEYSDFGFYGFFRALKDFSTRELSILYRDGHMNPNVKYSFCIQTFMMWLVTNGYAEEHPVAEWWTGAYDLEIPCPDDEEVAMEIQKAKAEEVEKSKKGKPRKRKPLPHEGEWA